MKELIAFLDGAPLHVILSLFIIYLAIAIKSLYSRILVLEEKLIDCLGSKDDLQETIAKDTINRYLRNKNE